jgi:DNA-binding HxlR family transcriptional regulator
VERLVDPGPPVRVSYQLTPAGRGLAPVISAVDAWAADWLIEDRRAHAVS